MDNDVIHKSKIVLGQTHNYLLYSVSYHPETNGIEEYETNK